LFDIRFAALLSGRAPITEFRSFCSGIAARHIVVHPAARIEVLGGTGNAEKKSGQNSRFVPKVGVTMSRIGRAPITLPKGVSFEQIDGVVSVKGPKGNLTVPLHPEISVAQEDGNLVVSRPSDSTRHKSLHGLTRCAVEQRGRRRRRRLHQSAGTARRWLSRGSRPASSSTWRWAIRIR
jgi:hypothetical protein